LSLCIDQVSLDGADHLSQKWKRNMACAASKWQPCPHNPITLFKRTITGMKCCIALKLIGRPNGRKDATNNYYKVGLSAVLQRATKMT